MCMLFLTYKSSPVGISPSRVLAALSFPGYSVYAHSMYQSSSVSSNGVTLFSSSWLCNATPVNVLHGYCWPGPSPIRYPLSIDRVCQCRFARLPPPGGAHLFFWWRWLTCSVWTLLNLWLQSMHARHGRWLHGAHQLNETFYLFLVLLGVHWKELVSQAMVANDHTWSVGCPLERTHQSNDGGHRSQMICWVSTGKNSSVKRWWSTITHDLLVVHWKELVSQAMVVNDHTWSVGCPLERTRQSSDGGQRSHMICWLSTGKNSSVKRWWSTITHDLLGVHWKELVSQAMVANDHTWSAIKKKQGVHKHTLLTKWTWCSSWFSGQHSDHGIGSRAYWFTWYQWIWTVLMCT